MRKQLISVLMAALLCVAMLPIEVLAESRDDVVSGKIVMGDVSSYDYSFDVRSLTTGSNTKYSKALAQTAALLACNFHDSGNVRIVGSETADAADTKGSLLSDLGFGDIEIHDMRDEKLQESEYDTVGYTMARRVVKQDSQSYAIYLLSIRATYAPSEWRSNVDIGANSSGYFKQYGNPREWKNRNHHKGFDVAANRMTDRFDKYINSFADEDRDLKKSVMITGHSRGAALSNLIGKRFEDRYNWNKQIKPYTYTIAPPTVTVDTEENCSKYRTIFNIVNEDDIVTCLPFKSCGFNIYGRTYSFSMRKNKTLRRLWYAEKQDLVLRAFAKDFLMNMGKDFPELGVATTQLKQTSEKSRKFETINAQKLADAFNNVLLGPDSVNNRSRNNFYEYNETVWIPKDTADEYSKFYVDAPYDPTEDVIDKAAFDKFSRKYNCKRVRISPMFIWTGILRIIETMRDDSADSEVKELQQIAEEAKEKCAYYHTDEDSKEEIQKLLKTARTNEDLKVLMSAVFCKSGMNSDKIEYYADNFIDMLSNFSLHSILCAHMPMAYYLAIQHNALH